MILVAALCVCVFVIALCVAITVLFSTALSNALANADRMHARNQAFQDRLLDRLMAVDFATYKGYESAATTPAGEFVAPSEQAQGQAQDPSLTEPRPLWGTMFERLGDEEENELDDPLLTRVDE